MGLFDNTFHTLKDSLNYATQKNHTINSNIANVDTPDYKAKDVVFKDVFENAKKNAESNNRTNDKHMNFQSDSQKPFHEVTNKNTRYNNNGNNVDIDKEMASLSKNQIYYQGLVDRMNGKFNDLQSVVRGGN